MGIFGRLFGQSAGRQPKKVLREFKIPAGYTCSNWESPIISPDGSVCHVLDGMDGETSAIMLNDNIIPVEGTIPDLNPMIFNHDGSSLICQVHRCYKSVLTGKEEESVSVALVRIDKDYKTIVQHAGTKFYSRLCFSPQGDSWAYALNSIMDYKTLKSEINVIVKHIFNNEKEDIQQIVISPRFERGILPTAPTFSPDGQKIAYSVSANGTEFIMIGEEKISPDFDYCHAPVFSPDGSYVTYGAKLGGKAFVMENDKKASPDFDDIGIGPPVFSCDGKCRAIAAKRGSKWFILVDDKYLPMFDEVRDPVFSPDGKKIAYLAREGNKWFIMVNDKKSSPDFDTINRSIQNKTYEYRPIRDHIFSPDGNKVAYLANTDTLPPGYPVLVGYPVPLGDGVWVNDAKVSGDVLLNTTFLRERFTQTGEIIFAGRDYIQGKIVLALAC